MMAAGIRTDALLPHFFTVTRIFVLLCIFNVDTLRRSDTTCNLANPWVELNPDGRALQQVEDRGYADKYAAEGQPIHLIGGEFSRERRTLLGFELESLAVSGATAR
jgi:hypothetical protein